MATVTAAKIMTVNDNPFKETVLRKAMARQTKKRVSAQPEKLLFPVCHKIVAIKKHIAVRL